MNPEALSDRIVRLKHQAEIAHILQSVRDETIAVLQEEAWNGNWWANNAVESFYNMTYNEQHHRALKRGDFR